MLRHDKDTTLEGQMLRSVTIHELHATAPQAIHWVEEREEEGVEDSGI